MKYVFGAIIGQDKDNGGYWAEVPDLPGCYGQGDTFIEAVESISNGVETHIAALLEDDLKVPKANRIESDEGSVVYIYADPETVKLGKPSILASEAAERLGMDKSHISQLIASGELEAYRMSHCTMVAVESVELIRNLQRKQGVQQ